VGAADHSPDRITGPVAATRPGASWIEPDRFARRSPDRLRLGSVRVERPLSDERRWLRGQTIDGGRRAPRTSVLERRRNGARVRRGGQGYHSAAAPNTRPWDTDRARPLYRSPRRRAVPRSRESVAQCRLVDRYAARRVPGRWLEPPGVDPRSRGVVVP